MLVDPECRAILDQAALELNEQTLPQIRRVLGERLAALAENAVPPPQPVWQRRVSIAVAREERSIGLTLFEPAARTEALPAFLHMHGGGFVFGTSPFFDSQCALLAAEAECLVASVDYRVAPETRAPGPVEDCYRALRWLHEHASDVGVLTDRIAVGGESAGGGLAAALCLLARDRGEFEIRMQCLTYPMLDDRTTLRSHVNPFAGHFGWSRHNNHFAWRALLGVNPGADSIEAYAAPGRATNLAGMPPSFVMVGQLDLFLEENVDYATRLMRAGVPTELHVLPRVHHGFDAYFPEAKTSRAAHTLRLAAVRRALHD